MSFFHNIFKRSKKDSEHLISPESTALATFNRTLNNLLDSDKYIARNDYKQICTHYDELFKQIDTLHNSGTLHYFCKSKGVDLQEMIRFIDTYKDLSSEGGASVISDHNNEFIRRHLKTEKTWLDNVLKEIDSAILLDEDQRRVVLSDEDYTLVIAGAGAGKTTTVAAKVKYLVERQGIDPRQILVISFTNKAVGELKSRINKDLKIDCPITTFHKTGYAVLRRQSHEIPKIADQGFMFNVINNYLKGNILENPELVDKLILFFGSYFDAPYEGDDLNDFFNHIAKADFSTLKGNIDEYTEEVIDSRTQRRITIARETLRSVQEVLIANFLFMHNINYEYEKPYQYNFQYSHRQYTPDFTITQGDKTAYIEHFGITEDGRNNRYTEEQLEKYKKEVRDKVRLHREHKTDLIYTFSSYKDGRPLLDHLKEKLQSHGFELKQRPSQEVFEKIVNTEENRYILRIVKLVCTFIQNFKVNGYGEDEFFTFYHKSDNERTKLFLTICEQCYHEYSKRLKEKHAIDFEDMINESARIIREEQLKGEKLDFKYIIVDEYQDISRQRFNLTLELSKLCSAKIIAVGDDWQSIYAFSGSDISLFTKFAESFGYAEQLSITKTYRNAQELIDIAGGFVQTNNAQIRKRLISPKHLEDPIVISSYTEDVDRKKYAGKGGKYYLIGETVNKIIDEIVNVNPDASILLLGRYGFDAYNLGRSADFRYDEKKGNLYSEKNKGRRIDFMTVHRSKGLGYDYVIVINARNDVYGFPSKIEDDPVLRYVVRLDRNIEYAEERRLFYVALTRTKNRVYLVTPEQHPSEFVVELIDKYPNVRVDGNIIKEAEKKIEAKRCPVCGYPLQFRYKKAYGLRLWLCSNEPEICDFMTNDVKGRDLQILKCDRCKDGYLIVRSGRNGEPFLGCTNYRQEGCGCNRMMSYREYKAFMHSI